MRPTAFTRLAAAALTNCAQNPVTGNPNFVLLTEADGRKLAADC